MLHHAFGDSSLQQPFAGCIDGTVHSQTLLFLIHGQMHWILLSPDRVLPSEWLRSCLQGL